MTLAIGVGVSRSNLKPEALVEFGDGSTFSLGTAGPLWVFVTTSCTVDIVYVAHPALPSTPLESVWRFKIDFVLFLLRSAPNRPGFRRPTQFYDRVCFTPLRPARVPIADRLFRCLRVDLPSRFAQSGDLGPWESPTAVPLTSAGTDHVMQLYWSRVDEKAGGGRTAYLAFWRGGPRRGV